MSLKQIFEPELIAIIGASDESGSVGSTIFQNLVDSKVKVFPVNPKHDTIGGQKSYKSILDIPDVDLAIVIIPAKYCLAVLSEIVLTKCKSVILISAGFKEVGGDGTMIENQIKELCEQNKITLIGPNCLGVINPILEINMSFSASMPPKGNIALVSQSGAICTAIIDSAEHLGLGFSKFISTGNKAVVNEAEIIEFLDKDTETKLIAIYCESLVDAPRFIQVCRKCTKPIIILKAGKSTAGAATASSHTGALASDVNLYKALFRQAKIIEVDSIQDLLETMQVISHNPLINLKNIAIITNAGGPGVLATDAASCNGLNLTNFDLDIINKLKNVLPPTANFHNPIDLIGDATSIRYKNTLDIVMQDSGVDAAVIILTPQSMTDVENIGKTIIETKLKFQKPIVVSMIGFQKTHKTVEYLRSNNVSVIDFPENAVRALSRIRAIVPLHLSSSFQSRVDVGADIKLNIKDILVNSKIRKYINEIDASLILKSYNLPVPKSKLARNAHEAVQFTKTLGTKIVLKVISQDIFHKTDVGGVLINLSLDEVKAGFNKVLENIKTKVPNARIDGILVSEYIDFTTQNQFVLGVKKDSNLGHSIMFGLGGIFVEVFKDAVFGFVPIDESEIDCMIDQLQSKPFLFGTRGLPPLDIAELKKVILNLTQLVTDFPEIQEIDLNPVVILEKGVKILDVKIIVD